MEILKGMTIKPIIPIWIMAIVCVGVIVLLKRKSLPAFIRQILIIVLLFAINLRVMLPIGKVEKENVERNLYCIFVIDGTISMLAEDGDGTKLRLDVLKDDCAKIIDELYGCKFGVISFNNKSQIRMPFSEDAKYAENVIRGIYPVDYEYARGTTLNSPKEQLQGLLKEVPENSQIAVFYMSDGEITKKNAALESFAEFADYIDYGAVVGYGTTSGARMLMKDYWSDTPEYIEDRTDFPYKDAISRLDETNLRKIASDLGVDYIHRDKASVFDKITKEIADGAEYISKEDGSILTTDKALVDIYYFFAIPILLLLCWEAFALKRRL